MTKVTETACQVKPCPRVVRCCAIVRAEEVKPAGNKVIDDKEIQKERGPATRPSANREKKMNTKPRVKPIPKKNFNKKVQNIKSLGTNLLMQPGWYYNKTNDKYINLKSNYSILNSQQFAAPSPSVVIVEGTEEDPISSVGSALYTVREGNTVLEAKVGDTNDCIDVAFEFSSDMLFASCKG